MSVCRICGHHKKAHTLSKNSIDGIPRCKACLHLMQGKKGLHEFIPYREGKTGSQWMWAKRNLRQLYGRGGWRRGRMRW